MSKVKTSFFCQNCGAQYSKWQGQCNSCKEWNTIAEEIIQKEEKSSWKSESVSNTKAPKPLRINEIDSTQEIRMDTTDGELNRVLGGGIVPGSLILLGGEPGIGKSTLLLQISLKLPYKTLYVSGEESQKQIKMRAERITPNGDNCYILTETKTQNIFKQIEAIEPEIVIIDSIQTLHTDYIESTPGSISQIRETTAELIKFAKESNIPVILIGHITKDGNIDGPKILEHMVDTVLYFEGDTHSQFRLVRAIKNRFGAVNEMGVFAMTERGLKGVSNPSAIFLSQHAEPVPGSCVMVTLEGTRPLLVEIQALVDSGGPSPRRLSVGLDKDRLAMLLAVLHRHAGVACMDQDVFINAVGGVRIGEPAADLAVMLAITSSLRGKPLPKGFLAFGEVGLAGEVRPAPRGQERLKEAAKLGFTVAVVPKANAPKKPIEGMTIHAVERVEEAMNIVRGLT